MNLNFHLSLLSSQDVNVFIFKQKVDFALCIWCFVVRGLIYFLHQIFLLPRITL